MKRYERAFVYTAIIALLAVNAVLVLSSGGRTAFAEAAAWLQELGPAESVKLIGEGGKDVSIRAKSGRVAWGDGDFKQTYTVAFVDIGKVLNPLLEATAFVEEREALRKELEITEREYREKVEALQAELRGMDQNSPEFREKLQAGQTLWQEYEKWGREVAMKRRDEMDVRHLQAAYKELTNAVNVVADKLGADIVLRFIPAENEFKSMNADQALTEIRLRTAVKYPEKLDITTEVMEELSIQDKDE
jgi:Skp family chaperone for outer membrane proteins